MSKRKTNVTDNLFQTLTKDQKCVLFTILETLGGSPSEIKPTHNSITEAAFIAFTMIEDGPIDAVYDKLDLNRVFDSGGLLETTLHTLMAEITRLIP